MLARFKLKVTVQTNLSAASSSLFFAHQRVTGSQRPLLCKGAV